MAVRALEPHPLTPSPSTRRRDRIAPSPSVTASTAVGALLIAIAFFLPWVQGDGVFAMRTFSGFGFAGALHNLTTGLATSGAGSFAPMLFYALPASAAGLALFSLLAGPSAGTRAVSLAVAVFAFMLVGGVLILALTPLTDATRLLGAPSYGIALTALGATLLLAGEFRGDRSR